MKFLHFYSDTVQRPMPSYQVYKGTLFEMVDQAVDFIMSKIDRSVGTRGEGPVAPVKYEIPQGAIFEAVVNAVAHRDYASNASVQVMLFSDRLEIWNPGHLPPELTIDQLYVAHTSVPHNLLIANALFLVRYIEKAGTGILTMIKECLNAGLPSPEFRQEKGQFVQVLWRKAPSKEQLPGIKTVVVPGMEIGIESGVESGVESVVESGGESGADLGIELRVLTPMAIEILSLLKVEISGKKEIAEKLGKPGPYRYLNELIARMVDNGLIAYTIPEKPASRLQQYKLTQKGIKILHLKQK